MDITTVASFAITGVVVGLLVEYTKKFFTDKTPAQRTIYTLALSVVGGLVVFFWHLIPQNIVVDIVGVVGAVNTAYLVFIKYLPNNE